MRVNREREILNNTVVRAQRIGKVIYAVFAAVTVLSALITCANLLGIIFEASAEKGELFHVGGFAYSTVQSVVMTTAYLLCALVARDASRGMSPFSSVEVRRVLAAAWILAVFTMMSLVWDPVVSEVVYTSGAFSIGQSTAVSSNTLFINFGALVATGALFLFAYILKYGATLQQFSDETL